MFRTARPAKAPSLSIIRGYAVEMTRLTPTSHNVPIASAFDGTRGTPGPEDQPCGRQAIRLAIQRLRLP